MILTLQIILVIILVISFIGMVAEKGELGNRLLASFIASLGAILVTLFVL